VRAWVRYLAPLARRPARRRAARSVLLARPALGEDEEVPTAPVGARQHRCPLSSGWMVQPSARASSATLARAIHHVLARQDLLASHAILSCQPILTPAGTYRAHH
jgi:hypothetical protein